MQIMKAANIFATILLVSNSIIETPAPDKFSQIKGMLSSVSNLDASVDKNCDIRFIKLKVDSETYKITEKHFKSFLEDKASLTNAVLKLFENKSFDSIEKDKMIKYFLIKNIDFEFENQKQEKKNLFNGLTSFFEKINDLHLLFYDLKSFSPELKSNMNFLRIVERMIFFKNPDENEDRLLFINSCLVIDKLFDLLIENQILDPTSKSSTMSILKGVSNFFKDLKKIEIGTNLDDSSDVEKTNIDFLIYKVFTTKNMTTLIGLKNKFVEALVNTFSKISSYQKDLSLYEKDIKMLACLSKHIICILNMIILIPNYKNYSIPNILSYTHELSYAFGNLSMSYIMTILGFKNEKLYQTLRTEGFSKVDSSIVLEMPSKHMFKSGEKMEKTKEQQLSKEPSVEQKNNQSKIETSHDLNIKTLSKESEITQAEPNIPKFEEKTDVEKQDVLPHDENGSKTTVIKTEEDQKEFSTDSKDKSIEKISESEISKGSEDKSNSSKGWFNFYAKVLIILLGISAVCAFYLYREKKKE